MKEKCVTLSTDGYRSPLSCAPHLLQNQLAGPIDLTQLPASLEWLCLQGNQLTGPVDLTLLPAMLKELNLGQNQLSGAVDLTKLPAKLKKLNLSQNSGLTRVWHWKPGDYDFSGTGIRDAATRASA